MKTSVILEVTILLKDILKQVFKDVETHISSKGMKISSRTIIYKVIVQLLLPQ